MSDWQNQARCRAHHDPAIFFPIESANAREAKKVCAQCPVRLECLDFALRTGEKHGVWGGCTEAERKRIRRVVAA